MGGNETGAAQQADSNYLNDQKTRRGGVVPVEEGDRPKKAKQPGRVGGGEDGYLCSSRCLQSKKKDFNLSK